MAPKWVDLLVLTTACCALATPIALWAQDLERRVLAVECQKQLTLANCQKLARGETPEKPPKPDYFYRKDKDLP